MQAFTQSESSVINGIREYALTRGAVKPVFGLLRSYCSRDEKVSAVKRENDGDVPYQTYLEQTHGWKRS